MARTPRPPEALTGISGTALGVAAARATESRRPDRLFNDPYAQLFLDSAGSGAAWTGTAGDRVPELLRILGDQVAVRTRFLDQALLAAARGGVRQVVLVACGLDARSHRLPWPQGTVVYELDLPEVIGFRTRVLHGHRPEGAGLRRTVSTDLRGYWPPTLRAAGHQSMEPTAWLLEGILYALPPEAADLLLQRITALSAPGSSLALEHATDSPALRAARAAISEELVELWEGGPAEPLDPWLKRHGWDPEVWRLETEAARYGRKVPAPFDPRQPESGRSWLATATLLSPDRREH